jgi:hypothetical protein
MLKVRMSEKAVLVVLDYMAQLGVCGVYGRYRGIISGVKDMARMAA